MTDIYSRTKTQIISKESEEMLKHQKPITVPYSSWYKIPEITISNFIKCCEPIYKVLEEKNKSKTLEDPFLKTILCNYYPSFDWDSAEKARLKQKVLEMKMGDFHEELLGKLPGWETLEQGHESGMDVRKIDESIYIECKNKYNTCNADGLKEVHQKLQKIKNQGKRAIFVQINCPDNKVNKSYSSADAEILTGEQIYTLLSGRNTFYSDLLTTIEYVFKTFTSIQSLKTAAEIL
jgi:hypothetical protein